ncbi:hypothetical protein MBLNU459_g7454t1 [Dothideomycetes sp. NU459]
MEQPFKRLIAARPAAQSEQAQPKQRRPHRPRKDYTNLDKVFDSLDDLKTALRQYIDSATHDAIPQYISCAMTLALSATLPLKSPLEGPYSQGGPNFLPFSVLTEGSNDVTDDDAASQRLPLKSISELVNITNLKERQIWQRAAAKGIVTAVQDLDGFKYCFNNNWTSKDDDGYRYSYTCLDSLENKDRHANGFRATNAAKRRPGANTRGVRKPTYDCKGQIAIKFSGVRQSVEVVYKHHPIHKTVAERKPPPRKDSKKKDQSGEFDGEDPALIDFSHHGQDDDQVDNYNDKQTGPVNVDAAATIQPDAFAIESHQPLYPDLSEQQPLQKTARRKCKKSARYLSRNYSSSQYPKQVLYRTWQHQHLGINNRRQFGQILLQLILGRQDITAQSCQLRWQCSQILDTHSIRMWVASPNSQSLASNAKPLMLSAMLLTFATALAGVQAAGCHHFKAKLMPFDEENCRGLYHGKQRKMDQGKCYNFEDFRSYQVQPHHVEAQLDHNCTMTVFETPNCSGRSINYGDIRDHPNTCGNAVFMVDPKTKTSHSGRSAKLVCLGAVPSSKSCTHCTGPTTVTTVTSTSSRPSVYTVTRRTTDHAILIAPPLTEYEVKTVVRNQTVTVSPAPTPSLHTIVRVEPVTSTMVATHAPVEVVHSTKTVLHTPSTTRFVTYTRTRTASAVWKQPELERPTRRAVGKTVELNAAEAGDKCDEDVDSDNE